MNRKLIGFLGYDDLTALDLVGPMEAFANAAVDDKRCYDIVVIGLTGKPFASESGLIFNPHRTIQSVRRLDTLIIPGGRGLRRPDIANRVSAWVKSRANRITRIASVCTGIYGLAPTGLLDGRQVTTHWRFAEDVARSFPRLRVNQNAIFLKDGAFYTSAGITAGIDLSLALIEEDFGPGAALSVARELVVYLKRSGGQEQYSEPLRFQTQSTDRFGDLAAWIVSHLDQDLSVEALAARTYLSPRQFGRRFKSTFGSTPGVFVETLRLDEARRRLLIPHNTIDSVALSVGFKSSDAFRRAFERRFGTRPSTYRSRFHANGDENAK